MAYFPNSSAGEVLDAQCCDCPVGIDTHCPVALVQCTYNYDQLNKGNEKLQEAMSLLINDQGMCQMREALRNKQDGGRHCCDECGNLFDLLSIGHVVLCSGCRAMLAERER